MEALLPTPEAVAEATRSTEELFEWSGYVHLGAGAEECPDRAAGGCLNTNHFHAWVCLPNAFQIRDIVDKARAAKARKVRALRDAGAGTREASDSYVVLEHELDGLRAGDGYEALLSRVGGDEVDKRLPDIIRKINGDPKWEHHQQDVERFRHLELLGEDGRDEEEFTQLRREMVEWAGQFEEAADAERAVEIRRLRDLPVDDVIERMRQVRIEETASEVYLHTYYTWAMFIGAREPSATGFPQQRKFADLMALKTAPPEVVAALREKIRVLEERTTSGRSEASGNS